MKQNKFSILKRIKSFGFAFNGLKILIKEEHNARVHLIAAISVILAGLYFDITMMEWLAVSFAIGFVITIEIINSAIENISDFISPEKNDSIKKIKDLAAAGVLMSALTALVIGLIIFIPKISILI
ncbi:diacylglycerol kinase family protein [Ancylomarina euxinus]|uniref:Diacylglycerol kinase family protein n=1 Tax=Ancylomarina euxinus TaxID=2283627 RepID=A0A425XZS5_9BACT|nr:diacylglycerol kinase family protein [Ancylomarina euxinus]MCZ4695392.1 diacylglycerol kinase family protein [Ancylomarina euxinus]MUP15588.1 diacylglycerol kinase family protein [Ancylomarina euxinus]RRG20969.1 diacylglycerol kinase family protein [Ancylomarina euxinus]